MNKSKVADFLFSQYAIIDLPVEVCIERAIELCSNQSFGDAYLVNDHHLDIEYWFEDHVPDGIVTITRWQGTQTRVALNVPDDDDPYQDLEDFSSQFIKIIGFLGIIIIGAMLPDAYVLPGLLLLIVGVYVANKYLPKLNIYRQPLVDMSDYLQTEWDVLLVMLASDETGIMASLVEQGEADKFYQPDYLDGNLAQLQSK